MNITEAKNVIKVCLAADVAVSITGHKGIGKTQLVCQIGRDWEDAFTGEKSISVTTLYCATQEVTDLIGFPIKVWERSGNPVVSGVHEDGRIVTQWAEPCWWPKEPPEEAEQDEKIRKQMVTEKKPVEEIDTFWNRPKRIIFLDEIMRAQRDVMQAMYPLVLSKELHTHILPRGTRIVTADNFAGAYDVRTPDEAFLSRFCYIPIEAGIKEWLEFARKVEIHPKIQSFLSSNPNLLLGVPEDMESAISPRSPLPDPRSWEMVHRIEKLGQYGLPNASPEAVKHARKKAISGIIGVAAAEQYWAFSSTTTTFEDVLIKGVSVKEELRKLPDEMDKNRLREKLQIEVNAVLNNRRFKQTEADNLKKFLVELEQKDRATAILQGIFLLKNNGDLSQEWTSALMKGNEITDILKHLMEKKGC